MSVWLYATTAVGLAALIALSYCVYLLARGDRPDHPPS